MPLASQGGRAARPMTRLRSPRRKDGGLTTRERLLDHQNEQVRHFEHMNASLSPRGRTSTLEGGIPHGWEETKDSYGRVYYLHRESGHSCWVKPVTVQLQWRYHGVVNCHLGHLLSRGMEHEWVRVTMEADEDRTKLFTALYQFVVEDVTRERYADGPSGLTYPDIPTLTECHKQARKMRIKLKDYPAFLERVVRGMSVRLRGSIGPNGDAITEGHAAVPVSPTSRPRTPASCRSSKSMRKSFSFEIPLEDGYDHIDGVKNSNNAEVILRDPKQGSLSLAEYGSLQAKRFREKRTQEMETAKDMKRESEAHFGSPRNEVAKTPKAALPNINLVKREEPRPITVPVLDDLSEMLNKKPATEASPGPSEPLSAANSNTQSNSWAKYSPSSPSPTSRGVNGLSPLPQPPKVTSGRVSPMTPPEDEEVEDTNYVGEHSSTQKEHWRQAGAGNKSELHVDEGEDMQNSRASKREDTHQEEDSPVYQNENQSLPSSQIEEKEESEEKSEEKKSEAKYLAWQRAKLADIKQFQDWSITPNGSASKVQAYDSKFKMEQNDVHNSGQFKETVDEVLSASPLVSVPMEQEQFRPGKDTKNFQLEERLALAEKARQRLLRELEDARATDSDDRSLAFLKVALSESNRYREELSKSETERDRLRDELDKVREQYSTQMERDRIERAALTRQLHQACITKSEDSGEDAEKEMKETINTGRVPLAGKNAPRGIEFSRSELLDAKLSIARLTQRCKTLENELSRSRTESQSPRRKSPDQFYNSHQQVQEALGKFRDAEDRLAEAEEEASTLSLHVEELRKQLRSAEATRDEACQDALELRHTRDQTIALLKQKHEDDLSEVRRAQAMELASALCSAKEHYKTCLDEQREKFFNQSQLLEEQLQARLRAQSESHVEALTKLKDAHQASLEEAVEKGRQEERDRSTEALEEADEVHKAWTIQTRRRGAVIFLDSIFNKMRQVELSRSFRIWSQALARDRAEELVEVYGAAIDQTAAGARVAVVWSKVLQRALARAFSKWHSRTAEGLGVDPVRHDFYQKEPLYPGELRRKLRRRVKETRYFNEVDRFVNTLEVNTNGKVDPRTFHRGLLKREHAYKKFGQEFDGILISIFVPEARRGTSWHVKQRQDLHGIKPSDDWRFAAGLAIQRIITVKQRCDAICKAKAWSKLRLHGFSQHGGPRLGEFMRNMETEALQEEVRALHVQLGASKAEAWKYKRKLLANYLR